MGSLPASQATPEEINASTTEIPMRTPGQPYMSSLDTAAAVSSTPQQTATTDEPSDAETLALPGLPGAPAREDAHPPTIEEVRESTTTDPYQAAADEDAKSKKAAAENEEKAREAAATTTKRKSGVHTESEMTFAQ